MKTRALVFAVVLSGGLLWLTPSVGGYYDDGHYSFTYYLARECGYTPLQAHRLASANVSVDHPSNSWTEPVQMARQVIDAHTVGITDAAQKPRVEFHAFRDARRFGRGQQEQADQAIRDREAVLWQVAGELKNPGVALHFTQDIPAHAGYSSSGGHWLSGSAAAAGSLQPRGETVNPRTGMRSNTGDASGVISALDLLADPTLPMGATTDFLSYRPDKTSLMISATINRLKAFMLEQSRLVQRPANCTEQAVRETREAVMRANFVTRRGAQYATQFGVADALPDMFRANAAVERALQAKKELTAFPRGPIVYSYGPTGTLNGMVPGSFTLYGSLEPRLSRAAFAPDPVELSVWAAATRAGEAPYMLACRTVPGRPDAGPILAEQPFDKLPVGDLIVQAVTSRGAIARQRVTLTGLHQEVIVNLQDESETPARCTRQLTEVAQLLCVRRSTADAKTLTQLEAAYQRAFTDAESCSKTRPTESAAAPVPTPAPPQPAAPPPAQGRTAAGKVRAGAAAIAAGILAAKAYEEFISTREDEAATTPAPRPSSTTPTPTPTPTPPARCSTRNCIVNQVSGGCSCSGTVSTTCPTSSIQTQVGGACFNNGMYCAENLSCNNNRCERDVSQGGRCRF